MWAAGTRDFLCWYVDFRVPFVRNGPFLDTRDLQLDVVVTPDGSWRMKDEDDYATAINAGYISAAERTEVERAKDAVISFVEAKRFPFDGSYCDWVFSDLMPELPPRWQTV